MPTDKVKIGKSRFEDADFRELYMSKVERGSFNSYHPKSAELSGSCIAQ